MSEKIKEVPDDKYDFQFIRFLRGITEFAIRSSKTEAKAYGLFDLLSLAQDESHSELAKFSLEQFIEMINNKSCTEHNMNLIRSCIENIKEGKFIVQSISVLTACLSIDDHL